MPFPRRALALALSTLLALSFLGGGSPARAEGTPPPAPVSIWAETAADGVGVAWRMPDDGSSTFVTGYRLHRGLSADALAPYVDLSSSPGYGDVLGPDTVAGTTYFYAVAAKNAAGVGPLSAVTSAVAPTATVVPGPQKVISFEGGQGGRLGDRSHLFNAAAGDAAFGGGTGWWSDFSLSATRTSGSDQANVSLTSVTPGGLQAGTHQLARTGDAEHLELSTRVGSTPEWCYATSGSAVVRQILRRASGQPVLFDADITFTCEGETSVHRLEVRYGVDAAYHSVSLPGIDVGWVPLGTSRSATSTYLNTGTSTVVVSAVGVAPPDGASTTDWKLGPGGTTCVGAVLEPGESCETDLELTPTAMGPRSGFVVYSDSSPTGAKRRPLTGQTRGAPLASAVYLTRSGGALNLQIQNWGPADRTPTSWTLFSGPDSEHLTELGTTTTGTFVDPDNADGPRTYATVGHNDAGDSPMHSQSFELGLFSPEGVTGGSTAFASSLRWRAPRGIPSEPITSYAVFQGSSPATLTQVASVDPTGAAGLAYDGAPVPPGGQTYYAVAAITSAGQGPLSSPLAVHGARSQLLTVISGETSVRPLTGVDAGRTIYDSCAYCDAGEAVSSPNGESVVLTRKVYEGASVRHRLVLRRTDGTGHTYYPSGPNPDDNHPAWAPDGHLLAFTSRSGASSTVCKAAGTGAATCFPATKVAEPSWLDGSTLVVRDLSSASATLKTLRFGSSALTSLPNTNGGRRPVVSPLGNRIAYVVSTSPTTDALRVYSVSTQTWVTVPTPTGRVVGAPSWLPDGSTLYYLVQGADEDTRVYRSAAGASGSPVLVADYAGDPVSVSVSTPDVAPPVGVKLGGIPAVTLGSTVTPTFSATDAITGIRWYTLSVRRAPFNGGFGAPVGMTLTSPTAIALSPGNQYCFSVRAMDRAGNSSAPTPEQCTVVPMDDRSLTRSSTFAPVSAAAYWRSTAMRTTTRGATLTRAGAVSVKGLVVVATTCATCGSVDVLVGSTRVASLSLASSTTTNRRVLVLPPFSARSGTITLRVTSTGKPVVIDGLGVRH